LAKPGFVPGFAFLPAANGCLRTAGAVTVKGAAL
jgi:hypothetical protein